MWFALAFMPLLCWESCLVERMREYTSLFPSGTDVGCFVVQAPEVLVHPYVRCLILLINTVGLLWLLWHLVSCWQKKRQLLGEATVKHALPWPVPGGQLLALYWSLTCAYRATIQYYQRTVVKTGTQTTSANVTIQPGIQTTCKNVVVEAETQNTSENTRYRDTNTTYSNRSSSEKEIVDKEVNGSISLISKGVGRRQSLTGKPVLQQRNGGRCERNHSVTQEMESTSSPTSREL